MGGHECEYKALYLSVSEELAYAKQKIKEQSEQLQELRLMLVDTKLEKNSTSRPTRKDIHTSYSTTIKPKSTSQAFQSALPPLLMREKEKEKEKGKEKDDRSKLRIERHSRDPTSTITPFQQLPAPAITSLSNKPRKTALAGTKYAQGTSTTLSLAQERPRSVSNTSTSVDSDEAIARKLQEEDNLFIGLDDETYAKILQDIEDKKNALHFSGSSLLNEGSLLRRSIRPVSHRSIRSQNADLLRDEVDMSYENLVQLEDVACGLPTEMIERTVAQVTITASMDKASCTICLMEYEVGDLAAVVPSCVHRFHYDCLVQWLVRKKTCPICKEEII